MLLLGKKKSACGKTQQKFSNILANEFANFVNHQQTVQQFLTKKLRLENGGFCDSIPKRCKGVHCVDLGESFPTHSFLQNLASIQQRTSPVKFLVRKSFSVVVRQQAERLVALRDVKEECLVCPSLQRVPCEREPVVLEAGGAQEDLG